MSSSQMLKTPGIKTLKHLCYILQTSKEELDSITKNIDFFYYCKEEIKKDKLGNPILDKDGNPKKRTMYPSKGRLKVIQKNIYRKILIQIPLPENIKGGVKGNDNILNAKLHQGNKCKFATDLKNFYPSISHSQVIKMLLRNGFSDKVASILTKLTTYKYELPQGTPTSTAIANLIFQPVDEEIIKFCENKNIIYTRYVDDLSFSSKQCFQEDSLKILEIITRYGFKISHNKTFYTLNNAIFTGIKVGNNGIDVTEEFKTEKLAKVKQFNENQMEGIKNYHERVKKISKIKVKKFKKV